MGGGVSPGSALCPAASALLPPPALSPNFCLWTPCTKKNTECLFKFESVIKLWLGPGNYVYGALG